MDVKYLWVFINKYFYYFRFLFVFKTGNLFINHLIHNGMFLWASFGDKRITTIVKFNLR